jgi:mono/diheme cytochrome c family protein
MLHRVAMLPRVAMLTRIAAILAVTTSTCVARADDDGGAAARVFTRHCLPCHGTNGSAPLVLDSAERILRNRKLAAALVEDGTMPPSIALPSADGLVMDRRLSSEDRATLLAALGVGATNAFDAIRPKADDRAMRASDAIAPTRAWTMPAAGGARVRTFLAPNASAARVRGVRVADPGARAQLPIRMMFLAADPRRTLRVLDAGGDESDGDGGFEAMGNVGLVPSGALGALSIVRPSFELPPGFCFEVPAGDIAIETIGEPIGRAARVLPRVAWIAAGADDTRPVHALAIPAKSLLLRADTCSTIELTHAARADIDVVAVIVKGGAFLRSAEIDVRNGTAPTRMLTVPDYRMAFAEPWVFTRAQRVTAGSTIVARLGFDNTADNPQQPSRPPQDVEGGLPPLGEDAMVVVLYADAANSR